MRRVGKIKPQHKNLQWFGYKDTFLVPTPLPESPTREFSSLCQQTHLWRRKPYTPIYTTHQYHTLITTISHLLHTYLLHTNLLHTQLLHTNLLHTFFYTPSSTHQSSQLSYFTTKQLLLIYTTSISSKQIITSTTQSSQMNIYTLYTTTLQHFLSLVVESSSFAL